LARNIVSSAEAGTPAIKKRGTIRNNIKNKKCLEQGLLNRLPELGMFWFAITFSTWFFDLTSFLGFQQSQMLVIF
jgi:hypothetical protein